MRHKKNNLGISDFYMTNFIFRKQTVLYFSSFFFLGKQGKLLVQNNVTNHSTSSLLTLNTSTSHPEAPDVSFCGGFTAKLVSCQVSKEQKEMLKKRGSQFQSVLTRPLGTFCFLLWTMYVDFFCCRFIVGLVWFF